jgi:hypothetical protein
LHRLGRTLSDSCTYLTKIEFTFGKCVWMFADIACFLLAVRQPCRQTGWNRQYNDRMVMVFKSADQS